MSNMSYCRFENTLQDLRDCYESLDNESIESYFKKYGGSERKSFLDMLVLMRDFVNDFEDELEELEE